MYQIVSYSVLVLFLFFLVLFLSYSCSVLVLFLSYSCSVLVLLSSLLCTGKQTGDFDWITIQMMRMTKRMKITRRMSMQVPVLIGQVMMMDTLTMERLLLLLSIFSSSSVSLSLLSYSVLSRSRGQELNYSDSKENNMIMERRFEKRFELDDEVEK